MQLACAGIGKGRLRYATTPSDCVPAVETALKLADGSGSVYACASLRPRIAKLPGNDARQFLIPAGATWRSNGPDHCRPHHQRQLVLGGQQPTTFCVSDADALLRHVEEGAACRKGEMEVVVPASDGSMGDHHRDGRCPPQGHEHPNAAPTISAPGPQSTNEGTSLVFSAAAHNAISVADVDSNGGAERITISAAHGVLTPGHSSELLHVLGAGTASLSVEGPLTGINEALNGLTYTPAVGYHGADSLALAVDDLGHTGSGGAKTASASVAITVTQVDQRPVVGVPGPQRTAESSPLEFSLPRADRITVEDVDAQGGVEKVTLAVSHGALKPGLGVGLTVSGAETGLLTLEGTIEALDAGLEGLTYAPSHDYRGSDTLSIEADDLGHTGAGGPLTANASVAIEVVPVTYDRAEPDSYKVAEDQALKVAAPGLLGNDLDSDTPPRALAVAKVSKAPLHGALTVNPDGSFTYTPDHLFSGTDTFSYTDTDGNTESNEATVTIEVEARTFDTAVNDSYSVDEGGTLSIAAPGVLGNDTDSEGLPLEAKLASGPAHGSLKLSADGSFVYEPSTGYSGPDSFTYRDYDGNTESNLATVSIEVHHLNRAPTLTVPGAQALSENGTLVFAKGGSNAVIVEDADSEGGVEKLTLSVSHGSLKLGSTGGLSSLSGQGGNEVIAEGTVSALDAGLEGLTYAPSHDYKGSDTLSLEADDLGHSGIGGAKTATASVALNVQTVIYDRAEPDSYKVAEDQALKVAAPGLLGNDLDSDTPPRALAVAKVSKAPLHGALTVNPDGSFTYTPDHLFSGTDTFSYTDTDGNTESNEATVTIEVERQTFNTAVDDSYTTNEGEVLSVAAPGVLGNDTDSEGLPLAAKLVKSTSHGSLSLNADGSFRYEPEAGFSGADSFTYRNDDGNTESNEATVTIDVEHLDVAPSVSVPSSAEVDSGAVLTFSTAGANRISVEDLDSEGGVEKVTLTASHGTLQPGTTAGLVAHSGQGTGTLTLEGTITALNEALEGMSYTAGAHYGGLDALAVQIDDLGHSGIGGPKSASAEVAITVNHTNEAPTLNAPTSAQVSESTTTTPTDLVFSTADSNAISVADADSEGGVEKLTLSVLNGALKLASTAGLSSVSGQETGSITAEGTIAALNGALEGLEYKPTNDFSGSDSLSLEIDDLGHTGAGGAKTASGSVAITVVHPDPVPANPTYSGAIGNTQLTVGEATTGGPDVEDSGSLLPSPAQEPDGSALSITAETITSERGGTVAMKSNGTFSYQPPVGFDNGNDTFHYTETDTRGGKATGTVTIKLDNARVWYVNDTGSAGNGGSNAPFDTLSAASSADSAGDVIFLYGTGTEYGGGIVLKANQVLDGQDDGLEVEGDQLVSASGADPAIANSSGAGITLAEGDRVKGVEVKNTSGAGIAASNVNGFTLDSKVAISATTGDGLEVSGGSGTITDEAAIKTSSAHSLSISKRTGGTASIDGAIEDSGTGVTLAENTGASIAFSGRLTLSTGANEGFRATGGGTVSATGAESTIASTTGTALQVESTTIGAAGLKLRSISAGTPTSGPSQGIVLRKTGASGGLDVTGNGSAGSGGTIEHTTAGDSAAFGAGSGGIYLDETSDVSLADMDISSNKANGVYGTQVGGFSITGATVSENGSASAKTNDSGLRFDGLAGTASISSSTISGSGYDNAMITSESSGSLTLGVKHSTFGPRPSESNDDGLEVEATGTAAVTLNANEEDTFRENFANGLETRDTSSGAMHLTVEHDSFTGNSGTGVDLSSESGGEVEFDVANDTLTGQQGSAINLFAKGSGKMVGTVAANNVGSAASADSGSIAGSGIELTSSGSETMTADVRENKIVQIESENGINAAADQGSAKLNLTLQKNEIHTDQTTSRDGILVDAGAALSDTSAVCLNTLENTSISSGTEAGNKSFNTFGLVLEQQVAGTTFQIQGYTGSATSTTEVASYVNAHNTKLEGTEGSVLAQPSGSGFTNGTCPTAP